MKFLMVSEDGCGAGLLYRLKQEGNDVELYVKDQGYRSVWDGILDKVKKINPDKNTIVIFDMSGMGDIADKLKKSGIPVVGGSGFADLLEHDRQFGLDAMEECGIKVPLTAEFTSFSDIPAFLRKNGGDGIRFVFKPSGKNLPTHLTYCAEDDADLLKYAKYVETHYPKVESFVIQQFVKGVCVSTEMWSDGTRLLRPANHTVEVKKFMNNELGPSTGCSGNLVWVETGDCRIVDEGVSLIESMVVKEGYVGPIDLNSVVNSEGVWGLEWTPRFGYDAMPTLLRLFKDDVGKFFSDLAKGQVGKGVPLLTDEVSAGVRLTIPPYPLEPRKQQDAQKVSPNVGIPIRGVTDENVKDFYFYEIQENAAGDLEHSEGTGLIACVTAIDKDPRYAFDVVYERLEEIQIPDMQYRTDLCGELCKMKDHVEEHDQISIKK